MFTMFLAWINAKYNAGYQGLFAISMIFDYILLMALIVIFGN